MRNAFVSSVLGTLALTTLGLLLAAQEPSADEEAPGQEAFQLSALLEHMDESNRNWHGFLDRPSLSCGIYRLAAGAKDGQSPHGDDEVYYVLEGKAVLSAGDEELSMTEGSIAYVAKQVPHRFHDIEEDLVLLVFFSREG